MGNAQHWSDSEGRKQSQIYVAIVVGISSMVSENLDFIL